MSPRAARSLITPSMWRIVNELRRRSRQGTCQGLREDLPYVAFCTIDDDETGTRVMFTRDAGHHTSGWLKNPEYERCYHLSLSFYDGEAIRAAAEEARLRRTRMPAPSQVAAIPHQPSLAALWVSAFFGDDKRLIWEEGWKSFEGKAAQVRHWRLFCDGHWRPIKPRGEVYSTELTEKGWRSWSEVQAHAMTPVMESAT